MNIKSRNVYRYKEESIDNVYHEIFNKINLLFNLEKKDLLKEYYPEYMQLNSKGESL